jgi:hypothetical protein
MSICVSCESEYDKRARLGKPGRATVCEECAEEEGDSAVKYTGFVVYGHKTSCELQINADPRLTEYLINATKLKQKGSNLGDNIVKCSKYKSLNKTQGACVHTVDALDYKNKSGL